MPVALGDRTVRQWLADRRPLLVDRVRELIAIPTVSPDEEAAFPWLVERVEELGGTAIVEPAPAGLDTHPAFTVTQLDAPLRANLRASFPTRGDDARRLLFNAHVDVVPAGGWRAAFAPRVDEGDVVGRGAADTKGNIAMLLGALELLRDAGLEPQYDVDVDFVVEEEIGGNGTLATVASGVRAGEVIVLEPTGLAVFNGHRGCLSFELEVRGRAAHMGSAAAGLSAIDGAMLVLRHLRDVEAELAAPLNVGFIHGGEWHGSCPVRCELRGNAGFWPPDELGDVRGALARAVASLPEPWPGRCALTYSGIHNEPCLTPADAPLVGGLAAAVRRLVPSAPQPSAWNASCDARFYQRLLGLPVAIFGCGELASAHGADERVSIEQLEAGIRILCDFLTAPPGMR